jgi:predicted histidine transporter YuiF (NhaC family)
MKSQRLAPLSGIAFVVLVAVGFIAVGGNTPDVNDTPTKITSYWADHHDKQVVAAILVALGAVFLAIFTASSAIACEVPAAKEGCGRTSS